MQRILILIIGCLVCNKYVQAQDYDLLHKYWVYKERFYKNFIRIDWGGDGIGTFVNWNEASSSSNYTRRGLYTKAGFSIPVDAYHPEESMGWGSWIYGGFGEDYRGGCWEQSVDSRYGNADTICGGVSYGGDSHFRIGNYLALLVTEYELLRRNNQNVRATRTLEELYLALQAVKRLDMTANRWLKKDQDANCTSTAYPAQYTGQTGLILREDAPYDLWKEYRNPSVVGNPFSNIGAITGHQAGCGLNIEDDAKDGLTRPVSPELHDFNIKADYATLSQDQIAGLFLGLRFITKLLPDDIHFNGVNIKHEAAAIAIGVIKTIDRQNPLRPLTINTCPIYKLPNKTGGETAAFLYTITRACELIAQEAGTHANPFFHSISFGLLPGVSQDLTLWSGYYGAIMPFSKKVDVLGFDYNFIIGIRLAVASDFGFIGTINNLAKNKLGHAAPFFPMASAILRGFTPSSIDADMKTKMYNELKNAPCDRSPGKYNYIISPGVTRNYRAPDGWRHSMKWDRCWKQIPEEEDYGFMNGVDYMLGYNLYCLLYGNNPIYYDVNAPENINYPVVEDFGQVYPIGVSKMIIPFAFGSSQAPAIFNGSIIASNATLKKTINFRGTIFKGDLNHKAGHSIILQPGFKAESGSNYTGIILPITGCN